MTDSRNATHDALVHEVCDRFRAAAGQPACEKCMREADTPYGPGMIGCYLVAEETIELVRKETQSASGATTENPEAERMIRELLDDCDKGGWWMIQPKLKKLLDVVRQQPKKCTPTATREPNACPICGTDFPHNHRWPWAVADNPTRPTMIENLLSQDEQGRAALASAAIEEAREQLRLIIEAPENRWHSRQWMKESARLALKALQDIPSASAPSATASPVGKTDHFSDNREPDAWLEVHEGSDEVLDATLIKPDDGEPGVRYVPLYSAAPAKEIEVIDPYVMDLVREHGSTMTNSEIVQKFLPKRSLPSASGPSQAYIDLYEAARDAVDEWPASSNTDNLAFEQAMAVLERVIATESSHG